MKIQRKTEIETNTLCVGDQIYVSHYTATCQKISEKGALFLLDQYLDEPMKMNAKNTNQSGYGKSDLREALQSDALLNIFADIRDNMVPFESGDLLRIPYYGEMFDNNDRDDFVEPDSNEQWPLMTDAHNRVASRCGEPECGWLANTVSYSSAHFCIVATDGYANGWGASNVIGVRPAFLLKTDKPLDGVEK